MHHQTSIDPRSEFPAFEPKGQLVNPYVKIFNADNIVAGNL